MGDWAQRSQLEDKGVGRIIESPWIVGPYPLILQKSWRSYCDNEKIESIPQGYGYTASHGWLSQQEK